MTEPKSPFRARCQCGCGVLLTARQAQRGGLYATKRCFGRHAHSGVANAQIRAVAAKKAAKTKQHRYTQKIIADLRADIAHRWPGKETFTEQDIVTLIVQARVVGYRRGWSAAWARWKRFTAAQQKAA